MTTKQGEAETIPDIYLDASLAHAPIGAEYIVTKCTFTEDSTGRAVRVIEEVMLTGVSMLTDEETEWYKAKRREMELRADAEALARYKAAAEWANSRPLDNRDVDDEACFTAWADAVCKANLRQRVKLAWRILRRRLVAPGLS
jgi:hypothetical protein